MCSIELYWDSVVLEARDIENDPSVEVLMELINLYIQNY